MVSVQDFSKINRFGSLRFGKSHFPVRLGSACVVRTRRGSVRMGSVRFRIRFRPVPEFNGSVRFGSVGHEHMRRRVGTPGRIQDKYLGGKSISNRNMVIGVIGVVVIVIGVSLW